MTMSELLKHTQYLVDANGERTGVVISVDDWLRLVAWIEAVSDSQLAEEALDELAAAEADLARAGWLEWQSVRGEWLDDEASAG
jgi:hypothetical protein